MKQKSNLIHPCEVCNPLLSPSCTPECQEACPLTYKEPKERIAAKSILFEALSMLMDIDRNRFVDLVSLGEINEDDYGHNLDEFDQMAVVIKMKKDWYL